MAQKQYKVSQIEKKLLQSMDRSLISKAKVVKIMERITSENFVLINEWLALSMNESRDTWARLESYKIAINRCVSYPETFDSFFENVIQPLGIEKETMRDMTMASFLPIESRLGKKIFMVNLPIDTGVGRVNMYFSVNNLTELVDEAVVYPESLETGDSIK